MILFLIKGLLRDKNRSLFPVITVVLGVMLVVLFHCWVTGVMGDFIDFNAKFVTGHVKIMSRAYAENEEQLPNDLALIGTANILDNLKKDFPEMDWVERIRFGGLLDAPDESGETRAQGPCFGTAVDLLSGHSSDILRLNIEDAIIRGRLPAEPGQILISDQFAHQLDVSPGDVVTLLGSTMYGSMAVYNFTLSGTVTFGIRAMDRAAIIVDIADARFALDMQDAAGEILGYFQNSLYDVSKGQAIADAFNASRSDDDEFSPVMKNLKEQNDLATLMEMMEMMKGFLVIIFIIPMAIVLWNAGLIGGLRRYGEVGVRLAIGEQKGHIYGSMLWESLYVGVFGSLLGTCIGLFFAYLLQTYGINMGNLMRNATIMFPTTFRAHITKEAYYIGFVPGLVSTILGTSLSGIGIYKRKTAQLFKELEA